MTYGEFVYYSPYFALTRGLDADRSAAMAKKIDVLPGEARDFLTSEELAEQVQTLCEDGTVAPSFHGAVAKIVGLVAIGDVPSSTVPELLTKLGVIPEAAERITNALSGSLEVLDALRDLPPDTVPAEGKGAPGAAVEMKPVPPLTTHISPPPLPPIRPPKTASKNVVDLRSKPQA